jgi:hypothetical protein
MLQYPACDEMKFNKLIVVAKLKPVIDTTVEAAAVIEKRN